MKTLVTGGAGFLGSHLVERLLAEGHEVEVVDDLSTGSLANLAGARAQRTRRLSIHRLDLRTPAIADLLAHRRPDVVFHLASVDAPWGASRAAADAEVNVIGTLQLLQGAPAAGVGKVVFTTTATAIYGSPEAIPIREAHPQRPRSASGVAKKAVFDYLQLFRDTHGLEFSALALADVYGPREEPAGSPSVVTRFAWQLLARERPTIFGDGRRTRDLVYVDDAVDAVVRAAERGGGLLLNVGTGVGTSLREVYEVVARTVGVGEPPRAGPARPGDLAQFALDAGRAEIHLGWKPWTSLPEGVERTVDALRARGPGRRA